MSGLCSDLSVFLFAENIYTYSMFIEYLTSTAIAVTYLFHFFDCFRLRIWNEIQKKKIYTNDRHQ